jgi:tellurite resistance protein
MAGLFHWIKSNSGKLLDPDRDARVERAARHLEKQLAVQRKAFALDTALQDVELFTEDIPLVTRHAYRSLVSRAWRDGELSEGEHKTLDWAAQKLGLDEPVRRELQQQVGLRAFRDLLGRAIDDGVLDENETASLHRFAANLDFPLGQLMRLYFVSECDGLLRGLFLTAIEDGRLARDEWARLTSTVERLGLRQAGLLIAIQKQAERFVEQTLAEMKADGRITQREDELLEWMLSQLITRPEFVCYVNSEVAIVKRVQEIEGGRLPSIQSRRLGLRAGEIVHAESIAEFFRTRQLRSGPRTDAFAGTIIVTDYRTLFDANAMGFEINHRRVLDIRAYQNGFEVSSSGKGSGFYRVSREPELLTRIYRVAVKRANQTIVCSDERLSTRHIPRDVRQRVWQRYGGRCAECAADDYLEFDHIVPVAKGGGNSDVNVQLLCRRCNGKKSDMI